MDLELIITLALVVANVPTLLICYFAPPRPWARRLCLATLIPNGLALLLVLKAAVDLHQGKADALAGLFLLPGMVLFVESLLLIQIYQARFRPGQRPPPASK